MSVKRFLLLFFFVNIICITVYISVGQMQPDYLIPKFWVIYSFFSLLTLLIYFFSVYGVRFSKTYSVYILLGGILIRLFLSLFLVLIYLSHFKVNHLIFITNFFSLYFLFTIFEMYCLLCNLRHQNKK